VNAFLDKMAEDIKDSLTEEDYEDYKSKLHFYLWLYPYVAQILTYVDVSHEKLYLLLHALSKKLPKKKRDKPLPVEQYVDLQTLRVVKKHAGSIILDAAVAELDQEINIPTGTVEEDEIVSLSEILGTINKKWGTEFGKQQQETLEHISSSFADDEQLQHVVKNPSNQMSGAKIVFDHKFDDKVHETYETDDKLYTQLMNNNDLRDYVQKEMFKYVFGRILAKDSEPAETLV
jgi:type I restriction enzyme R subunit